MFVLQLGLSLWDALEAPTSGSLVSDSEGQQQLQVLIFAGEGQQEEKWLVFLAGVLVGTVLLLYLTWQSLYQVGIESVCEQGQGAP